MLPNGPFSIVYLSLSASNWLFLLVLGSFWQSLAPQQLSLAQLENQHRAKIEQIEKNKLRSNSSSIWSEIELIFEPNFEWPVLLWPNWRRAIN